MDTDNNAAAIAPDLDPETEFLASKRETGFEWELFKENVRPLKRGRNVAILNHALKSDTHSHIRKSLLENRMKLIEEIDRYQGDDPLHPWIQCIKWVQEAFPPGGDSSGLVVIYERCVRTFSHDDRYKDDLRYLKVWLEYAECCIDADVIYGFLEANKIGLTHSAFYISYALHMESKNRIRAANEVFYRGISQNAQPVEKLKAAYRKFFIRSMRRSKSMEEDSVAIFRLSGTQTTESFLLGKEKLKTDRAQGSAISIYKDEDADTGLRHQPDIPKLDARAWQNLGVRVERNKENNAVPSKWTSNKIPQRFGQRTGTTTTTAATPSIEIFADDEYTEEHNVDCETEKSSSILHFRERDDKDLKKETELLRKNPLRNFPASSLPR